MSCSSKPPILDNTKEIGKVLQQVIPLLRDLESLFAGLSTDIPGITEEDKIDIRVMPRAIHTLISHLHLEIDMYTSQAITLDKYDTMIATITSDGNQVI